MAINSSEHADLGGYGPEEVEDAGLVSIGDQVQRVLTEIDAPIVGYLLISANQRVEYRGSIPYEELKPLFMSAADAF